MIPEMQTTIEICIVGYESGQYAPFWVDAARRTGASLALADNAPGSSSISALESLPEHSIPTRTLRLPHNPGFGAACNRLAETSKADWLLFLNPDANIVSFERTSLQGRTILGARQRNPAGRPIHCAGRRYGIAEEIAHSWLRYKPRDPVGSGYVSGGAMIVERTVFAEIGGFDERFFLFYEDIDFCLRASNLGIAVRVEPSWDVVHELGHATRRNWDFALTQSYLSGRYFHQKQRHLIPCYDAYVSLDSIARWGLSSVRGNRTKASAYKRLAGLAGRSFKSRSPVATERTTLDG